MRRRRATSSSMSGRAAGRRSSCTRECESEGMAVRCLIVDDNERFLQVACDLLKRDGIAVVGVATNSAEAFRQAERLRPDVALVDIMLGEEHGFDLASALAQASEAPHVILISTYVE